MKQVAEDKCQTFRVVANRAEEIHLEVTCHANYLEIKDFPHKQIRVLLLYIIASCPNLKTLSIR